MSTDEPISRSCDACGKLLQGRKDKKFCNDSCRNNYNNFLKSIRARSVRSINTILEKNRRILQGFLPEGVDTAKASKEKLVRLGFQFRYLTHTYTTKKNEKTYYYCYDHGYLPLDNNWFLIVRQHEE